MPKKVFLSIDLGAGSGRIIAAKTDLQRLYLEEVHRFSNPGTELPGGSYWNVIGLYRDILEGLRKAVATYGDRICSIGIDTWGCDFGLLDENGRLLGMPHQYRDSRFEGMAEKMHERLDEHTVFRHTGVRTNFYNSSLHLLAEQLRQSPSLLHADRLLFIPDLLAYWLTGVMANERTVASTSQLFDPRANDWAWPVIDALGLPRRIFGKVVEPGTILGPIRAEVADYIGKADIPVIASASHDTASAVAGIPMSHGDNLWLSSGTWSIMGLETQQPITSEAAFEAGFCNELGHSGTVRFLKNISGLWLIQECKRQWAIDGEDLDYAALAELAIEAPAFTAFIDPDHPSFSTAGDMPEKIQEYCRATGQNVPQVKGKILRIATDSIALKYRVTYDKICHLTGSTFARLHVGGGGIQNSHLTQATANALGIEVIAGPVEATSCGNIAIQMIATGHLPSMVEARELIKASFEFKTFVPCDTAEWAKAYDEFRQIIGPS
jgi:sugar (pentulose or hexulose) kinase